MSKEDSQNGSPLKSYSWTDASCVVMTNKCGLEFSVDCVNFIVPAWVRIR